MSSNLRWRIILVLSIVAVAGVILVPSVMWDYTENQSRLPQWWQKSFLPKSAVTLGLDLQGGMHLVVSVKTEEAVKNELLRIKGNLADYFREENIPFTEVVLDDSNYHIRITFPDRVSLEDGTNKLKREWGSLIPTTGSETLVPEYVLDERILNDHRNNAVQQVLETLNSRIDEFGVAEPSIQKQGRERIVIQLPGIKEEDRQRVIKIIRRTAKLEFLIVEEVGATKEEILNRAKYGGSVPLGMRMAPEVDKQGNIVQWFMLNEEPKITGDYLVDARAGFDRSSLGGAIVNFEFNSKGAQIFSKITGQNIGELLAIVLEGRIYSAPRINAKIYSKGIIEGNFGIDEASDLSLVLRAGALPVSIEIEEERTVGPTLGHDLIIKGRRAVLVGMAAVVVFMLAYYNAAGMIATLALVVNMVLVMAALASLHATLTLPGVAGLVLTVGMAVDANIIIFERIREELRTGKTPRASVDAGYARSMWTILDANITTLIAAAILFQVGTGPIRGFAVTLTLGVISSVFTALVLTRLVYDLMFLQNPRLRNLHLGIKTPNP
jgi:preprotein translocase subunit SecD